MFVWYIFLNEDVYILRQVPYEKIYEGLFLKKLCDADIVHIYQNITFNIDDMEAVILPEYNITNVMACCD